MIGYLVKQFSIAIISAWLVTRVARRRTVLGSKSPHVARSPNCERTKSSQGAETKSPDDGGVRKTSNRRIPTSVPARVGVDMTRMLPSLSLSVTLQQQQQQQQQQQLRDESETTTRFVPAATGQTSPLRRKQGRAKNHRDRTDNAEMRRFDSCMEFEVVLWPAFIFNFVQEKRTRFCKNY